MQWYVNVFLVIAYTNDTDGQTMTFRFCLPACVIYYILDVNMFFYTSTTSILVALDGSSLVRCGEASGNTHGVWTNEPNFAPINSYMGHGVVSV